MTYSHVSVSVIQQAIDENIILLKNPTHITEVLQALYVEGFGRLKKMGLRSIREQQSMKHSSELFFVNNICQVWKEDLSEANVITGFGSTEIYPVDQKSIQAIVLAQVCCSVKRHVLQPKSQPT